MFKGTRQGGGGSEFVDLTGLFPTKKGNGMAGFVKISQFETIRNVLEMAEARGVDVMFYVGKSENREGKTVWRASITPSSQPSSERAPSESFQKKLDARADTVRTPAPRTQVVEKKNPPADPLDKFLEDFKG